MANTKKNAAAPKAAEVKAEAVKVEAAATVAEEKKAPAKKTTAAKKTTTAKKTTAKKTETACSTEKKVIIQYAGNEICTCSIVAKAKEASGIASPKKVEVYVKPEENKAYYVIDDVTGDVDLF